MDYILDGRRDDAGATGGADNEVDGAVCVLHDAGRHGGERSLARADVVCGGGDEAECVTGTRDAEVYFFVQD
jgi:hypothetical protein